MIEIDWEGSKCASPGYSTLYGHSKVMHGRVLPSIAITRPSTTASSMKAVLKKGGREGGSELGLVLLLYAGRETREAKGRASGVLTHILVGDQSLCHKKTRERLL